MPVVVTLEDIVEAMEDDRFIHGSTGGRRLTPARRNLARPVRQRPERRPPYKGTFDPNGGWVVVKAIGCSAVLFDLDGVLVDSTRCVERHWRVWARRHGRDADEILRIAHGRRTVETLRMIAPELDIAAEVAALAASEASDMEGVDVIAGARELLEALPRESWTVVTSGTRAVARARLRHCELPVPATLIAADDVDRGKPAPEGFLAAADRLGREPDECVVVEDSPAGIEAARAARMRIIAVASTHDPAELGSADAIVRSVADIDVRQVDGGFELVASELESA